MKPTDVEQDALRVAWSTQVGGNASHSPFQRQLAIAALALLNDYEELRAFEAAVRFAEPHISHHDACEDICAALATLDAAREPKP